jgi:hypothetical protein
MSHAPEKPPMLSVEASPEQQAQPARCALATGSAGWWLTGWQRLWRKSPSDEHHEIRIYRKLQAAEDRYQRENKMGRYSLPNIADEPRPSPTSKL